MNPQRKFIITFGIICMLLGSLVFVGRDVMGIMVDLLQGFVYIASGLFAFAAVMQGVSATRRYSLLAGLVYSAISILGLFNHHSVLSLFRVNNAENFIHLFFALFLLFISVAEQQLARWMAPARRV